MPAERLIFDLSSRGCTVLTTGSDEGSPREVARVTGTQWPVDDKDLQSLRWYLEDYLRAPYAVYGEHGAAVAAALPTWGQALFCSLFAQPEAAASYARIREGVGEQAELVLRSSDPELLAIPWELM